MKCLLLYNMSILDQNITTYILKWDGVEGLAFKLKAEIEKEDGEKIGKVETKGLMTKKTHLFDTDNSEILNAAKSNWSLGAKYEVKDSKNNKIGVVSQKVLSRKKIMTMKNPNDEEILRFEGSSFLGDNHEIKSLDDKSIAVFSRKQEVVKTSRWKGKTYNTCTLQIKEPGFDRKILFGMFLSCLSSYLDYNKSEMQESIESIKK